MTRFQRWMWGLSVATLLALFFGQVLLTILGLALGMGLITWAVCSPRSSLFGPLQYQLSQPNAVALTFDDGPNPDITPKVLDILDAYGAKATFFVIGSQAERYPDLLRNIVARGHALGQHSYTHSAWTNLQSVATCKADFKRCEEVVFALTGKRTQLFRPPMGLKNPNVFKAVNALDYRMVTWSCKFKTNSLLRSGDIVLFHDGYHLLAQNKLHFQTPVLLEQALQQIRQRGWTTEVWV